MLEFFSLCVLLYFVNTLNYRQFKHFLINQTGYFKRKDRLLCFSISLFGPISTLIIYLIQFIVYLLDEFEYREEILEDYRK